MESRQSRKPVAKLKHQSPPQTSPDPGREAWMLLLRLLRVDQGALLEVWAEFDLSSAQGDLLCSIDPDQPATMVSLARALHCHDSNVTGLVDRLEQRGLIERRNDPNDRRVKLIALTKAGEKFQEKLLGRLSEPLPFIAAMLLQDKIMLRDIMRRASKLR
jgi:DNA-binding MarR family transcriptional regulator